MILLVALCCCVVNLTRLEGENGSTTPIGPDCSNSTYQNKELCYHKFNFTVGLNIILIFSVLSIIEHLIFSSSCWCIVDYCVHFTLVPVLLSTVASTSYKIDFNTFLYKNTLNVDLGIGELLSEFCNDLKIDVFFF